MFAKLIYKDTAIHSITKDRMKILHKFSPFKSTVSALPQPSSIHRPICRTVVFAFLGCLLAGLFCGQSYVVGQELPHSYARPDQVAIKHLHLDLKVDFAQKKLIGSATMTLDQLGANLILDTDKLSIESIKDSNGQDMAYVHAEAGSKAGQALSIQLPKNFDVETNKVVIVYSTSPAAEAVQWLEPNQTTDKRHPFLFTQSQAILARTWVPCQDTPAVRMTYSARMQVPKELLAAMSASNPKTKNETGIYEFKMEQPIPSYLLALAVGDLEFTQLAPGVGVYAEPSVIKKAAWELEDTPRMVAVAEGLYGPYRWDDYDVIFLPSSFPFGGMENPRLTFATPTILAGDRSLVALIAHELAHSWSGNLVTNSTWNDFWLNEGFTVYFEQRIMEAIYGREYSEMLARLTLDSLLDEVKQLDERDTWLKLDLSGRNPDDGMTGIAYDKGYFFLRMLEEKVGRDVWDAFLKTYFESFAFKSMTTEQFVEYLEANLPVDKDSLADIRKWVYGPGLPESLPTVNSTQLSEVTKTAAAFLEGTSPAELKTDNWTTHHWNHFLRSFKDKLTTEQMTALDAQFKFTESGNSEITHDWLLHVIAADYQPGMARLEEFLVQQGRRKFLRPLYARLAKSESGLAKAKDIYAKARPGYHAVSRQTIDEILGVTDSSKE